MATRQVLEFILKAKDEATKKIQKLGKNFKASAKNMEKFSQKASGLSASFAGVGLAAGFFSKKLVDIASDSEETGAKFDTVFKGIDERAQKTAKSLAKGFNISNLESERLLSGTADLLKGFGFTADGALDLSNDVQRLAGDLASFNNLQGGTAQASEIITKALLGERDSLITLGVKISEADVQAQLLAAGQNKLAGSALLAAKAQATQILILKQTKDAQGDVARTSESFANQQRRLTATVQNLAVTLGEILLPMATKIVSVFAILIEKFSNLSPLVQKIIVGSIALAAAIGLIGAPVLFLIGVLPKLVVGIKAVGAALTFLSTNPVGIIITAIGVMILLIAKLITGFDSFKQNVIVVSEAVAESISGLKDKWEEVMKGIKSITVSVFNSVVTFVTEKVEFLKNQFKKVTDFIAKIKNAIVTAKQAIKDAFSFGGGDEDEETGGNVVTAPTPGGTNVSNQNINVVVKDNNIASPEDAQNLGSEVEQALVRTLQLQKLGSAQS